MILLVLLIRLEKFHFASWCYGKVSARSKAQTETTELKQIETWSKVDTIESVALDMIQLFATEDFI